MDCYILSIHKLIHDERVTPSELAFMTNYTVTRAWIDTEAATTFNVPIIYPNWFPNIGAVQALYPQIRYVNVDTFFEYFELIQQCVKKGPVVTAIDRYYLRYITPRRHMGAHYIVIYDVFGGELEYFDPFDQRKHVMRAGDLELWTSPSQPAVQHMGRTVLFADCSYRSSMEEISLDSILVQRTHLIRSTIRTMRGFRRHSVSSTRALRFFLKIALSGMKYSDFKARNGRLENWDFFAHHDMPISAVLERAIIGYYCFVSKAFGLMYVKKFTISKMHWFAFLSLYIAGLRFELIRYQILRMTIKHSLGKCKIGDIMERVVS